MREVVLRKLAVLLGVTALFLSSSVASAQECVGDCNANGSVSVSELIRCVRIALGDADIATCLECDSNGDGSVRIPELITAVTHALCDCQACAPPVSTSTPTKTLPPTATPPIPTATAGQPTATVPPVTTQDGGVLFGERCLDCHEKFGSDIADGSAAAIVTAIDTPSTGMGAFKGLFSTAQIDALARYLTMGMHSSSWQSSRNHGRFAATNGVATCQECHGGPSLMGDGAALSCFTCHGMLW